MKTQNTQVDSTPPETHCFKFNVHEFGLPLSPFSVSEWGDGTRNAEEEVLKSRQFTREPGRDEYIEIYSSTWASGKYLIIVRVPPYRFIFYVLDDASLLEWQRLYQQMSPAFLAQKFLPPPPTVPEMVTFSMNLKVLRGR